MSENSHSEIWEKGKIFVCPDQKEELEVELRENSLLDLVTSEKLVKVYEEVEKLKNRKCKSCKQFKGCVNFAGFPAKANDNICPYYVPKKQKLVPRGQQKNGTAIWLELGERKESGNAENQG